MWAEAGSRTCALPLTSRAPYHQAKLVQNCFFQVQWECCKQMRQALYKCQERQQDKRTLHKLLRWYSANNYQCKTDKRQQNVITKYVHVQWDQQNLHCVCVYVYIIIIIIIIIIILLLLLLPKTLYIINIRSLLLLLLLLKMTSKAPHFDGAQCALQ